jgi:predicted nucleic acid-binding protein
MMPVEPLASLPRGEEILIDANVLVYAIGQRSGQCRDLLTRCTSGEVSGYTTVEILGDVCHRLMLAEAAGLGLIGRPNAANLQGKPHVVRRLSAYWSHVEGVSGKLAVLPLDEHRFRRAHGLRTAHGLMTNDSLVLAAANVFGIGALATNDSDFDAVPWITVYKPSDLP